MVWLSPIFLEGDVVVVDMGYTGIGGKWPNNMK
jgi:hypothetical protein